MQCLIHFCGILKHSTKILNKSLKMSLLVECGLLLQKEKNSDIQPFEKELSIEYHLRNYKKCNAVEN